MNDILFTADLHLNHPKALTWRPQFQTLEEMNETIIEQYNGVVAFRDLVYILGDVCLGSNKESNALVSRLKGRKILVRGNHDTDAKVKAYLKKGIFEDVIWATQINYGSKELWLSHYPTVVENHTDNPVWVIHGHTHSNGVFSNVLQNIHVGYEAVNEPVGIDEISSTIDYVRIYDSVLLNPPTI